MPDVLDTPWHKPTPAVEAARKQSKVTWTGTVAVYRAGLTPAGAQPTPAGLCRVESARHIAFNATRAIVAYVSPKLVERFFPEGYAYVYVRAEYYDSDQSIWFKERSTRKEFFETAMGGLSELPNVRDR